MMPARGKMRPQLLALFAHDDIEMGHVFATAYGRNPDPRIAQASGITRSDLPTPRVPSVEVRKLGQQYGRLHLVHAAIVDSVQRHMILWVPAVLPQQLDSGRDACIVRHDRPGVADGAQVLRRIEAEGCRPPEAAGFFSVADRAMSLRAILDHRDAVSVGDAQQMRHVVQQSIKMRYNHGVYALRQERGCRSRPQTPSRRMRPPVRKCTIRPSAFIETNVRGTFALLETALRHWSQLRGARHDGFRFVHVSTDEVFGTLAEERSFNVNSRYAPNSPYAASKAAADHLARAWHRTYGIPVIITNCSNNYGPWQHAEKLIPTVIRYALAGAPIPIYGTGLNVRDWLYVEDHVSALMATLRDGRPGDTYLFGGRGEMSNLDLATMICSLLDARRPRSDRKSYSDQITFVVDRPGHDLRYAVDPRTRKPLSAGKQRKLSQRVSRKPSTGIWPIQII
jgi:dTDP-glucose 4,6-dehydratase